MSSKNLIFAIFILFSFSTVAQTWNRQYHNNINNYHVGDFCYDTTVGGFVIGHQDSSFGTNNYQEPFGIKFNAHGDSTWFTRVFFDSNGVSQMPENCAFLKNKNIIVLASEPGWGPYAIVKYSAGGVILKKKWLVQSSPPLANLRIVPTNDNGYFLARNSDSSYISTNPNYFNCRTYTTILDRYDSTDTKLWTTMPFYFNYCNTSYPSVSTQVDCSTLCLSRDGGLAYVIDYDTVTNYGLFKIVLQKTDASGAVQWTTDVQQLVNGNSNTVMSTTNLIATSDSGFLLSCYKCDYPNIYDDTSYLLKFDKNGSLTYLLKAPNGCLFGALTETSNGRYLVNTPSTVDGYTFFDKHLNFISYSPSPFPDGVFYSKMVPNNVGGAMMAGEHGINNLLYIQMVNFDSLFHTYPSSISGNLILDKNNNCITDVGDYRVKNNPVVFTNSQNEQWFAFTNDTGRYNVNIPTGNFTLTHPIYGYKAAECPATSALNYAITTPVQYTNANLYDTLIPNKKDIGIGLYGLCFVPGFNTTMYINLFNDGTVTANTTITFVKDPSLQYLSSSVAPLSISGDTIKYSVSSLPADSAINIAVNLHTPSNAQVGQGLTFYGAAPFVNDINPANNTILFTDTTVSSFDPNEKTVNKPLHYDPNTGEMIYAVEFQNTGTYYAKNVVVSDSIDSHLDISTFRLINATPFKPEIRWWEGNRLLFTFNNIMLPDSLHNPKGSIGSFAYAIKPKNSVHVGDTILNNAYIFFDYNKPVVTNTTINIISKNPNSVPVVSGSNTDIEVYPNPSTGDITILTNQLATTWAVKIMDMTGREMYCENKRNGNMIQLHTNIPNGMYVLQLTNNITKESIAKKIAVIR